MNSRATKNPTNRLTLSITRAPLTCPDGGSEGSEHRAESACDIRQASDQFVEAFELLSKPPIAQLWLVPSCHSLLVKCRRISTTQESSHLTSKEPTGLAIII
jgi:hypothetical protein